MASIREYFANRRLAREEAAVWRTRASKYQSLFEDAQERLEEAGIDAMFRQSPTLRRLGAEDIGWDLISGHSDASNRPGPSWEYLGRQAKQIRELMSFNPHMHRGAELVADYVWGSTTVKITGIQKRGDDSAGKRGRKSADERVLDLLESPLVLRYVMSNEARRQRTIARFSDGWIATLWDDATKTPQRIPVWEITADYSNPDNPEEIWAYRREWNHRKADGTSERRAVWYFTDLFKDKAPKRNYIDFNGQSEPVDMSKTLIDDVADGQVGWALGLPYANTAIEAVKLYALWMNNGYKVSEAMAKYIYVLSTGTRKGAQNAALKVSDNSGSAGQTAAIAGGDLSVMSSAGKGYDFSSGVGIAAMIAAGVGLPATAILSDTSAAGGAYGSAQTLDEPTRLVAVQRQKVEADYEERVLRYLGAKSPKVTFAPILASNDRYRLLQGANIMWQTGTFHPDEIRGYLIEMAGIEPLHDAPPSDVMIPLSASSVEVTSTPAVGGDNQSTPSTDPAFDNPTTAGSTGNSPRDSDIV